MGKSKFALFISVALILASYFLLFTKGLNYGVDFAGGTVVQVKYTQAAPIETMRERLKSDKLFEKYLKWFNEKWQDGTLTLNINEKSEK